MVLWIAAAGEDPFAVADRRRDAFGGRAFDLPQGLSVMRIKTRQQIAAGQKQLVAPRDAQDDRRCVVGLLRSLVLPLDFASLAVERRQDPAGVTVGRGDDQRLIQGRRRAITLVDLVVADPVLPFLLTINA